MVRLYCEGKRGSLDHDVIERVIKDIPDVEIKPIGGKGGSRAIIEFYENQGVTAATSDFYLMFRDRDFDMPVPLGDEVTHDGHNIYFSYRTTIENYLFDVDVFYDFICTRKISIPGVASSSDIKTFFIDCAKEIKDYQAVRHALGAVREGINLKTTWTTGSGYLPTSLDLVSCKAEAMTLINKEESKVSPWKTDFESKVASFVGIFDSDFFDRLDFLIWFQGKDFAKVITTKCPGFPMQDYYKYALTKFGDYTSPAGPGNFLFDDLIELRNIIINKRHK